MGKLFNAIRERIEPERIRFICSAVLVISLGFLAASFWTAEENQTRFGPPLGADYAGFYTAGLILNHRDADRLYDVQLHDHLYHQLLPRQPQDEKLPYVHPPFVAAFFGLMAGLPYAWSFALWLVLSAGLYLAGLLLVVKVCPNLSPSDRATAILLALAFEPFIMECWLGGQLSAVGFFFVALGYFLDQKNRPFASGMALGFCLYKPTLLVLIVPMLLTTRRFKSLAGFVATGLAVAGVSILTVGWETCCGYLGVLTGFAGTTSGGGLALRLWKYVDLNSFFKLLLGGQNAGHWFLLLATAAIPFTWLAFSWLKAADLSSERRRLVWAATFLWTLVLNLYVGVYDSVLAVLGALILTNFLRNVRGLFQGLLLLLFVVPWFTQPVARATGIQVYTLVLAALGVYALALIWQKVADRKVIEGQGRGRGKILTPSGTWAEPICP